MIVGIKRRTQEEWAIQHILMLPFVFFFLTDILYLPDFLKYSIDIAWVFLLATMVINKFRFRRSVGKIALLIALFFLCSLIGLVLEYQSIFYYLWGFRNNARFFVFFLACVAFLRLDNAKSCIAVLDKVYLLNFVVALFQFFVMNKRQDYLGGVFGTEKGCNAYLNIFMIILATWHLVLYMNEKEKALTCLNRCIIALIVAAFAELKFFFVELIIALMVVAIMTKFSKRKICLGIGSLIIIAIFANILKTKLPQYAAWLDLGKWWDSATATTGYTNSGDMNRFTSVVISWNRFLDSGLRKLFGLGLGNCDRADGINFLTTPFYKAHKNLHYDWFSSSFMILETGAVGLTLYLLFFVQVFISARKEQKKYKTEPELYQLAKTMAVICPLLIIYDGSMRTEAAYVMYFVLALPFLKRKNPPGTDALMPNR